MGFETIQEVLAICKAEEMSILLGRSLVPRLYDILKRHPYRRQKN